MNASASSPSCTAASCTAARLGRALHVGADREGPRRVEQRGLRGEERGRLDRRAQGAGAHRGDRHALAVHGVERARRVAEDQQPVRHRRQPLVAAADICRVRNSTASPTGVTARTTSAVSDTGNESAYPVNPARSAGARSPCTPARVTRARPPSSRCITALRCWPGKRAVATTMSPPKSPVGHVEEPGGVREVDAHRLLRRDGQAEVGEPVRGAGPPAGGVDDEVGGHDPGAGAVQAGDPRAGDPAAAVRADADDVVAVQQRHVGQGEGEVPDGPSMSGRLADTRGQPGVRLPQQQAVEIPAGVAEDVALVAARGEDPVGEPGQQLFHDPPALRQQPVHVPALGHGPPVPAGRPATGCPARRR